MGKDCGVVRLKHSSVEPALYGLAASERVRVRETLRGAGAGRSNGGCNGGVEGNASAMVEKKQEVSAKNLREEKCVFAET